MTLSEKPKTKPGRWLSHLFDYPAYLFALFISWVFCRLPFEVINEITRGVGSIICYFAGSRKKVIMENLDIAFGELMSREEKKAIAQQSYQSAALSLIELFTVPKMLRQAPARFQFLNSAILDREFQKGKGVILVISHLGSWEYLSFLPFLKKQDWSVVVKDIRNPYLNEAINHFRKKMTVHPISKDDSAAKEIFRALKQNHGVAILMDQWAGPEGIWQKLFSEYTSTTSIPARVALKTGSSLVPAYCIRKSPGRYRIEFQTPVSIESGSEEEITREINERLAEKIKEYPGQWLWMHRRWKPKPDSVRSQS